MIAKLFDTEFSCDETMYTYKDNILDGLKIDKTIHIN